MSEPSSATSRGRRASTLPGLIFGCIVAFVWSFFQAASHEPDAALRAASLPHKLGYLLGGVVGQSLVIALLIWLVLYFAFVRRRDPDRGPRHFLALLGSAIGGGLVFVALVMTALATGAEEDRAIDAALDRYGEAVIALDNDLAGDVTAVTGVDGAINSLDGREDLPEARQRLEALYARIDEGEADIAALQAETIRSLEEAGASDDDLADYRAGQAEANALRDRATALMRRVVEANLALVSVLEDAGPWRIGSDDVFEFDRSSDTAAFAAVAARLTELTQEAEALQADVNAHQAEDETGPAQAP